VTTINRGLSIALLAAAAIAAGCAAPTRWEKPGVEAAEQRTVADQCRASASAQADRLYGRDYSRGAEDFGDRAEPFGVRMARSEAANTRDRLFAECMTSHGYLARPAK